MKNKKIILVAILILAIFVMAGCDGFFTLPCVHADNDNDCVCDKCSVKIKHVDVDNDGICDKCSNSVSSKPCQSHVDADDNHLCDICGGAVTPICTNHNFTGDWLSDENGHWHVCTTTGCNATDTKAQHVATDDGNCITALTCTQCNFVILAGKDGHVDADSDGLCDNESCQKQVVADCDEHLLTENWTTDFTSHWKECTLCSFVTEKDSHTPNDVSGDCTLNLACTTCQHVISQGKAHDFANGEWKYSQDGHWKKCENCPVEDTQNIAQHTTSDTGIADCTQDVSCSVCYLIITQGQASHSFTGDWQSDKSGHWYVCQNTGCQATDVSQKHVDSQPDGYCDQCDYEVPLNCNHADDDGDDICDICEESVILDIDLFGINDLHGKFLKTYSQAGVGGLTTYLKQAKASNPNTVFFSSGDMWQGSYEAGMTKGAIINDWMKEVGFAFMTLGNHEYDWGASYITQNVSSALPFLGINVYNPSTNQRADYAEPSVLVDLGDVQIGFIGAMGDCLRSISGEFQNQVTFKTGATLTNLVKAEATRLRDEEGADIIVYSIHSGSSNSSSIDSLYDESLSNGYVDIVFEAHTHKSYATQDSYGVWHLQAGGDNSTGIRKATMAYNLVTGEVENDKTTNALISQNDYGSKADHEDYTKIVNKYSQIVTEAQTAVGTNNSYLNNDALNQLAAQLYADAGVAKWGASYDIVLGGGKINCRYPYYLPAGTVTLGDLYMLFTFDNSLALCSISGTKLLARYINNTTGNNAYVIGYTPYGKTVKDSVVSSNTYYIIADSYNYTYDDNGLTVVQDYTEGVYARDLLADYIKNGGLENTTPVQTPTPNAYNSIEVLLAYGATLAHDSETSAKYYTSGTIKSVYNTTYGNMIIVDEDGNELTIYGTYSSDGKTKYGDMTNPPVVGDTINIYGVLVNYNGTIEIKDGCIVSSIPQ